jgi:hypothetical protein
MARLGGLAGRAPTVVPPAFATGPSRTVAEAKASVGRRRRVPQAQLERPVGPRLSTAIR